jgi:hypothetical protein
MRKLQILRSLSQENFESHEDGINLLKYLQLYDNTLPPVYFCNALRRYSPSIGPALWGLFPVLIQACVAVLLIILEFHFIEIPLLGRKFQLSSCCPARYSSHAQDYLTDMMGCFENYIVRGNAEFLRIPDYCEALVSIAQRCALEHQEK